MKNWLKENWFKLSLLFIMALLVFTFCYYYLLFLPKEKQNEILRKQQAIFYQECKEKKEKDFKFLDNMDPKLAEIGLKNAGYIDERRFFIDEDIWLERCVEKKQKNFDNK